MWLRTIAYKKKNGAYCSRASCDPSMSGIPMRAISDLILLKRKHHYVFVRDDEILRELTTSTRRCPSTSSLLSLCVCFYLELFFNNIIRWLVCALKVCAVHLAHCTLLHTHSILQTFFQFVFVCVLLISAVDFSFEFEMVPVPQAKK